MTSLANGPAEAHRESPEEAKVRLNYQDNWYEFSVPMGQETVANVDVITVLDAAERAGIDLPYSCCAGVCASCFARVTQGASRHLENHVLDEQDLADGYILVCQTVPTTPYVEIVYDAGASVQPIPVE